MLISVIVPVYNIEKYLDRCIASICNQTYKNLEIILIDDGSTDGSLATCKKWELKDKRIKVVHKENSGVSSARMRGIEESTGDLIGFVDGDDAILPNMYENLFSWIKEYDADIASCGYQLIYPDQYKEDHKGTNQSLILHTREALKELFKGTDIEPGLCCKLYKRSLFKILNSSLWDSKIRINEDFLMNYLLFKEAASVIHCDQCLYQYMLRENSASTSPTKLFRVMDPIVVNRKIINDIKEDSTLYELMYPRYIGSLFSLASEKKYKVLARKAKTILKHERKKRIYKNIYRNLRIQIDIFLFSEEGYYLVRKNYDRLFKVSLKHGIR